jgi:hypothetical protein
MSGTLAGYLRTGRYFADDHLRHFFLVLSALTDFDGTVGFERSRSMMD